MRRSPGLAFFLATIASLAPVAANSARAATPEASIVTPVAGGAIWSASDIAKLRVALDATLREAPGLAGAHVGVFAVDTATGTVLYERSPDQDFQPASTLKLVVGSAALDRLGAAFSFRTTLALAGGTTSGLPSLVLRMTGDPTFSSSDLHDAVDALGVTAVGPVYVDDTAFDDRPYPDGWTWDDFAQDYAPSVSAATLDENVATLRVAPGDAAGDPARVTFADGRRFATTLDECRASEANVVSIVNRASTGPPAGDDTIDVARSRYGCPAVVGSIPLGGKPEEVGAAVYSPLVAAADALKRSLAAKNVPYAAFLGGTSTIESALRPPAFSVAPRVVWTHDSAPLAQLLGPRFWIPSDNLFAELLLRELGSYAGERSGSTDGGIAVEKAWLRSVGVDPATTTLADGCGMSQYDRVTPRDLVTVLRHDWNGPNRQLVLDSLPIGGAHGTIEGIAGTPAAGRVFAKTGSMMHVRGLAGYLATQRHGAVAFAFEVDDWIGDYKDLAATRAAVLSRIVQD